MSVVHRIVKAWRQRQRRLAELEAHQWRCPTCGRQAAERFWTEKTNFGTHTIYNRGRCDTPHYITSLDPLTFTGEVIRGR